MCLVASDRGQLIERTSERRNRSSISTSSTPISAISAASANGSWAMSFMSKGLTSRKASAPILPTPREPKVRPTSPTPICAPRCENPTAPARVSFSLSGSFPVSASIRVTIYTAIGRRTDSGVMTRAMPASVQACTSTESYPTQKRAMTPSRPLFGTLPRSKRCARRMRASMVSSCLALSTLSDSRNTVSTRASCISGARSKSRNVGDPSALRKSAESPTRNFSAIVTPLMIPKPRRASPQRLDRADGRPLVSRSFGDDIRTGKSEPASCGGLLETQTLARAVENKEMLGLAMRVKGRLVGIDFIEQHAVALVLRLQDIELQASRLVPDRSVRVGIDESTKLRSCTRFEVKFHDNHKKHWPRPLRPRLLLCGIFMRRGFPAMLPKLLNSSKYWRKARTGVQIRTRRRAMGDVHEKKPGEVRSGGRQACFRHHGLRVFRPRHAANRQGRRRGVCPVRHGAFRRQHRDAQGPDRRLPRHRPCAHGPVARLAGAGGRARAGRGRRGHHGPDGGIRGTGARDRLRDPLPAGGPARRGLRHGAR